MVERLDGIKFRCMDPELVARRREWIAAGKPGHYPGCTCDRCKSRNDNTIGTNGPLTSG